VEYLRINEPALLGLTQPQLWALVSLIVGAVLIARSRYPNGPRQVEAPGAGNNAMTASPSA